MSERPLWRMVAGRKAGPYEPAKLRPLVKDGRIGPLDRFSYDGVNWQPANAFPELLRPPPAMTADFVEDVLSPLSEEVGGVGDGDLLGPPSLPGRGQPSGDDTALLKAIYLLIAFGGGTVLLLAIYIVVQSFWGTRSSPKPAPQKPDVVRKAEPRRPAADVRQEVVVDAGDAPPEDGPPRDRDAGSPAEPAAMPADSTLEAEPAASADFETANGEP